MFVERGKRIAVSVLLAEIDHARIHYAIEGVSLLGGEPLDQAPEVLELCHGVRARGLGLLLFSGYTRAEIDAHPDRRAVWNVVDTLIDGRFEASRPEPPNGRRFIGSRNQLLHHRTHRYADPALWAGPPQLEIHIAPDGTILAHGFPGPLGKLLDNLDSAHPGRRTDC